MLYLFVAIVCLIGLIKSADAFIDQSISLARKFKISSYVIGFTIVAFGTSLPELVTSLYSTNVGHTEIAISNVLGSNIANICLVLGILALFRTYKLSRSDVFYNIPINLIGLLIFLFVLMFSSNSLSVIGGIILLSVFVSTLIFARKNNHAVRIKSETEFSPLILILSLLTLILCGKVGIDNIIEFAKAFSIQESILGSLVVAVTTSMPELIASLTALKKGNEEIGIGNIMGSNLFNLLFVLGISSFIGKLDFSTFVIEMAILLGVTILLVFLAFVGKKYYFTRKEGLVLIIVYLLFVISQFV